MALRVEKDALHKGASLQQFMIKEKELNFLVGNLSTIIGSTSLLAGFAYSQIIAQESELRGTLPIRVMYFATANLSCGCNLISFIIAVYCVMNGPKLALFGGSINSINKAVIKLKQNLQNCLRWHQAGIFFLQASAVLWGWCAYSQETAIVMSIINAAISLTILFYSFNIPKLFDIPRGQDSHTTDLDIGVASQTAKIRPGRADSGSYTPQRTPPSKGREIK